MPGASAIPARPRCGRRVRRQRHGRRGLAGAVAGRSLVRAAAAQEHRTRTVPSRLAGSAAGRRRSLAADVQATLLELSAITVADALRATQPGTARVLACGGGVHNAALMARIAAHLPGMVVESTAAHGLDPDFVEAMGFAWLARETLAGRPGNLPSVTGAKGPGCWARSTRPEGRSPWTPAASGSTKCERSRGRCSEKHPCPRARPSAR